MDTISILFAGIGGQGVILASRLVARCAMLSGFMVKSSEIHGMAQRGGSVLSHLRFGEKVYSPLIPVGKADVLVCMEELEGLRNIHFLKPDGKVILNRKRIIPSGVTEETYPQDIFERISGTGLKVYSLDSPNIAREIGNPKVENIIILGFLSNSLPFPEYIWEECIREMVPSKAIETNIKAFKKGRELYVLE